MIKITSPQSLEQISTNELTQAYFKTKIGELIVMKRDNIPPPTVTMWYKHFKERLGWTKEKFDEQFEKVIKNTTFGVVKIDDFLREEKTYTEKEMNDFVTKKINSMITEAEKLMRRHGIEIELEFEVRVQTTAVKVMVANKILRLLERAERDTNLSLIDECFDCACERLGLGIHENKTTIKRSVNGR